MHTLRILGVLLGVLTLVVLATIEIVASDVTEGSVRPPPPDRSLGVESATKRPLIALAFSGKISNACVPER